MNDSPLYTIDVDNKPTIVVTAQAWEEVQAAGYEDWVRADLSLYLSEGNPLASAKSVLHARRCSADEAAAFRRCDARRGGQEGKLELLYLVALDDP